MLEEGCRSCSLLADTFIGGALHLPARGWSTDGGTGRLLVVGAYRSGIAYAVGLRSGGVARGI
jgi:hypothetical protein